MTETAVCGKPNCGAEDDEPVSPPNWQRTTGGITDEEIAHADHPVSVDGGQ